MKIVIFAPHPDDEIYGCGGSILKWFDEGHDLHVIYVTDNRALISWGIKENQLIEEEAREYLSLSEDEIGKIGLREALNVAKAFGFKDSNIHLFKFYDQDAINRIEDGKSLAREIIKDADRIVLPSDNNPHPDHQATHSIVKEAAIDLQLKNAEYYVYAIYTTLNVPPSKLVKIRMGEYRDRLYDLMKLYKTQLCLKDTRMGWETLKRRRIERFAVFNLEDANKFKNF
ncbi:MAG: PIG-L deacetylase family protein [Promethearchaeota archaeon]